MNSTGEIFRLLRIANNLTIKEMAEKLGVTSSYVSFIEKGARIPSDNIISKYSEVLGVEKTTIEFFIEENKTYNCTYQDLLMRILKKIVGE